MTKQKGFFVIVPNDLVRDGVLKPHELAVYLNLLSRRGNKRTAWPSHKTIATETLMSESKVKDSIRRLKELGLLKVRHRYSQVGRQTSNEYFILQYGGVSQKAGHEASETYEEDSPQEESKDKSPTRLDKRKWRHVREDSPATEYQINYLLALIEEHGPPEYLSIGSGSIDWPTLSQSEAHDWIGKFYAHSTREALRSVSALWGFETPCEC